MEKRVSITISLSTNPAVEGDYFLDVRDVTSGPTWGRQLTTQTLHLDEARDYLATFGSMAAANSIGVSVLDETGEVNG